MRTQTLGALAAMLAVVGCTSVPLRDSPPPTAAQTQQQSSEAFAAVPVGESALLVMQPLCAGSISQSELADTYGRLTLRAGTIRFGRVGVDSAFVSYLKSLVTEEESSFVVSLTLSHEGRVINAGDILRIQIARDGRVTSQELVSSNFSSIIIPINNDSKIGLTLRISSERDVTSSVGSLVSSILNTIVPVIAGPTSGLARLAGLAESGSSNIDSYLSRQLSRDHKVSIHFDEVALGYFSQRSGLRFAIKTVTASGVGQAEVSWNAELEAPFRSLFTNDLVYRQPAVAKAGEDQDEACPPTTAEPGRNTAPSPRALQSFWTLMPSTVMAKAITSDKGQPVTVRDFLGNNQRTRGLLAANGNRIPDAVCDQAAEELARIGLNAIDQIAVLWAVMPTLTENGRSVVQRQCGRILTTETVRLAGLPPR
ncbi:MAG: hypothetical protein SF002_18790 [Alphaproteobacteria bacterium]|nr:hypothetical protein [Alphaproteobacteria bacterium]